MLLPFKKYIELRKVKQKSPDPEEAASLIDKAMKRLSFIKQQELNDETASFVFEGAYSAAREAAQSLMSLKGYKPYSHEATISFVKEYHSNLLDDEKAAEFDRLRQLRDDSEYRAVEISIEEAKDCIQFAMDFIESIKN